MSLNRNKKEAIKNYLLEKIASTDKELVTKTEEAFGISHTTVYRYISELIDSGIIRKTKNGAYSLTESLNIFTLHRDMGELTDEQAIYETYVRGKYIAGLPRNVQMIWDFSFTEMMNNAIDHSLANEVTCQIIANDLNTSIIISDNGIGIFNNIQKWFGFDSIDVALSELFKGKISTDTQNHSGEGIFFTSRILDEFAILSSSKVFSHNRYQEIISDIEQIPSMKQWAEKSGTTVFMRLSNSSNREIAEVIQKFSDEDSFEFSKTSIPVNEYFDTYPVSRSQAKRLCARLDTFKEIELDFTGVSDIGQAFADEIFRVYQNRHPEQRVTFVNASRNVEMMIRHSIKNSTIDQKTT